MKLVVTIKQGPGRKDRVILSSLDDALTIAQMRRIFEAEQLLNNLPGSNLRWHLDVVDGDAAEATNEG